MTVELPRPEYPRPQFRRPDWTNLNGEWRFAFDDDDAGCAQGLTGPVEERLRWLRASFELVHRLRAEGFPLVGYTWWPLFSLVDWDYREGVKPAMDYLRHMGMYDLKPNGNEGFIRVETPIARAFREAAGRRANTLEKERVPKEDGRYIIFYSFEDEDEQEEVEDSGEDSTS